MCDNDLIRTRQDEWTEKNITNAKTPIPPKQTVSGIPVPNLATPADASPDYINDLGFPGGYPFTRGVYPTMYLGQPWTMRQYAGFGSAAESNKRFKFLIEQGQTGLSVAFDLPTQIGYDSDDPEVDAEVGRVGVAIDSIRDMEALFDGLPLDKVSTSFTINSTAAIILAMYIAVGEKQGVPSDQLRGTIQNDILKEYIARGTYIFPPKPSMRIVTDIIEYCSGKLPKFNPISISGYHMREAGCDAVQELAFTFSDGISYINHVLERGMDVDAFASRLSFFYATHNDIFEEVAKYRAARRLWARIMKEKFGAKNPKSCLMRFHTQTAGVTLTAEQPLNNVVRTACQTLAAVLGGAQSLHVNSYDEALTIPTEESVRLSLRTQQVIAHESGITATVDPLAGSYYVEYLTTQIENAAKARIDAIEAEGGMVRSIEEGRVQREITDRAYEYDRDVQTGKRPIVGRNKYRIEEADIEVALHQSDPAFIEDQIKRLRETKAGRDNANVAQTLAALEAAAAGTDNLMPVIIDAVREYATVGEITSVLKKVYGEFKQPVTV